jgi:hypothetical protein
MDLPVTIENMDTNDDNLYSKLWHRLNRLILAYAQHPNYQNDSRALAAKIEEVVIMVDSIDEKDTEAVHYALRHVDKEFNLICA